MRDEIGEPKEAEREERAPSTGNAIRSARSSAQVVKLTSNYRCILKSGQADFIPPVAGSQRDHFSTCLQGSGCRVGGVGTLDGDALGVPSGERRDPQSQQLLL